MRIALVHDYLREYGGAERVLRVLADIWPDADIYTAFCVPGSTACREFADRRIIESWFAKIPFYDKLYSPLRFLIPQIWGSFDFSGYDLVITSASWYITKGLGKKFNVPEICYCHTPPRWLYGYPTSVNFQKYWPVKMYATIVGHFLRMYDFNQAQKVDQFVANSQEVAKRIQKFYRRDSKVIYPPVELEQVSGRAEESKKKDYLLIVSRLVGGKGVKMAIEACKQLNIKLKIAGEGMGFGGLKNVDSFGYVSETEKVKLMSGARGFLALAESEDFGITPVEAMMVNTPVIAFNGGGYKETIVDGKTGILFGEYSVDGLVAAIKKLDSIKWEAKYFINQTKKFTKANFKKQMLQLVNRYARTSGN